MSISLIVNSLQVHFKKAHKQGWRACHSIFFWFFFNSITKENESNNKQRKRKKTKKKGALIKKQDFLYNNHSG